MRIDWFTLIAQAINFLALVWLLHRFLYGRIVEAMQRRKRKIAELLRDAEETKKQAEAEKAEYQSKRGEFEAHKDAMLAEAKSELESRRREWMDDAKKQVEEERRRWRRALQRERSQLRREFRELTGELAVAAIRKALRELANADLESQMLGVLLDRLDDRASDQLQELKDAVAQQRGVVEVRSAFELSEALRQATTKRIQEKLGARVDVRFERDPGLICGLELRALSHRLVWSLDSSLDAVEEALFSALENSSTDDAESHE